MAPATVARPATSIMMTILVVSSIFLASLDVASARYVMVLEKAGNCELNSRIILNYTYTRETNKGIGYVEFLEEIEPNFNIRMSISFQHKSVPSSELLNIYRTINNSKTDICVFLHSDTIFMPYIREYVSIGKYCPINKGKQLLSKSTVYFKRKPSFPMGCWKLRIRMEKDGKLFTCFYMIVQFLESLDSQRIKCG